MDFESDDDECIAETEVKERVNALASSNHASKIFATLLVDGGKEKFQLDSCSTVNLMSDKTVERLCGINHIKDLQKTPVTLVKYNQSEIKPLGKKSFRMTNPENNKKYSIEFHIVGGVSPCMSILDLRASKHLQLLTINEHNILAVDSNDVDPVNLKKENSISLYKDVFSGEGKPEG